MLAGDDPAGACFLVSMALFIGVVAPQMPPFAAEAAWKAAFYARLAANPVYTWVCLLIFVQLAPLALLFSGLFPALHRAEAVRLARESGLGGEQHAPVADR